jgi:hypothetical protein
MICIQSKELKVTIFLSADAVVPMLNAQFGASGPVDEEFNRILSTRILQFFNFN